MRSDSTTSTRLDGRSPASLPEDLGPWAVVTGASSGLGEEFARHLAGRGLHVVLAARSTDRLDALAEDLRDTHGVGTRVVTVDLADQDGAARVLDATSDLDVGLVVSNAGAGRPGAFLDHDVAVVRRRLQLNAGAHLELAHGFGRRFVARGGGGLLLVSALGASEGIPSMADAAAAKAAVASLGRSLHHELRASGVRVSVLLPGNVDTPIMDAFALDRDSLPMSPYPVDRAVTEAVEALVDGRPRLVPDRRMRVLWRLMPAAAKVHVNGRMMGRAAEELDRRDAVAP